MTLFEWSMLLVTAVMGVTAGMLMFRWYHWLSWVFCIASWGALALVIQGPALVPGVCLFAAVAVLPAGFMTWRSLPKQEMLMSPIYLLAVIFALMDAGLAFYWLTS
jgi:hypothetical protein